VTRIVGRGRAGTSWATVLLLLAALGAGAAACGRYGSPVRAEEYQQKDRDAARARAEREKQTSPQERNDPMPAAP
jgi:hypothetical protein